MIIHLSSLMFATFLCDGKTDFQLSFLLFWFLLPLSLFVCLLAYDLILFGTLSPPSPALSSSNIPCVLLSVWPL